MYDIDIFVNCNWVATRWQQCSTHLHTNNTQNDKKQTIYRTTQKFWKSAGRAPSWRVIPWHLITTEEKARKNFSQRSRTIRIHRPNNKNTQITVLNRNTHPQELNPITFKLDILSKNACALFKVP